MRRFTLAVGALILATAVTGTGCVTFCDDCHKMPAPAYTGASMTPGTYTGPSPTVGGSRSQNEVPRLIDDQAPAATNAPTGTNADSSDPSPPPVPNTNP